MIKSDFSRALACAFFAVCFAVAGVVSVSASAAGVLINAEGTNDIFDGDTQDPYTLAVRAYIWGMPLVEWAKVRLYHTRPDAPLSERPATNAGAAINRFGKARALYGPQSTDGVGPNNDTLYTNAWFDLEAGPFVVEMPNFGDRYYTFTLYRGDTTSALSPGRRTHGSKLPPLLLHGPNYDGPVPDGMLAVESPTRYLLIAGRIMVTPHDPEDLAEVHALQDQVRTRTLEAYRQGKMAQPRIPDQRPLVNDEFRGDDNLRFLEALGSVLQDWWIQKDEKSLVDSLAAIGLTPERGFDPQALSEDERQAVIRGLADARQLVRRHSRQLGVEVNGWTINYQGGVFGDDYLLRAAVARDQIGVSVPEEAIYPIGRVDAGGELLTGGDRYRIRFPRDNLPPVDAFWSITLYDDKGIMVDNPIDRYSIGDRTPGLVTGDDGDLMIAIQHEQPENPALNWLPLPAGPFYLMMRLYHPREEILEGNWLPPPIERQ